MLCHSINYCGSWMSTVILRPWNCFCITYQTCTKYAQVYKILAPQLTMQLSLMQISRNYLFITHCTLGIWTAQHVYVFFFVTARQAIRCFNHTSIINANISQFYFSYTLQLSYMDSTTCIYFLTLATAFTARQKIRCFNHTRITRATISQSLLCNSEHRSLFAHLF